MASAIPSAGSRARLRTRTAEGRMRALPSLFCFVASFFTNQWKCTHTRNWMNVELNGFFLFVLLDFVGARCHYNCSCCHDGKTNKKQPPGRLSRAPVRCGISSFLCLAPSQRLSRPENAISPRNENGIIPEPPIPFQFESPTGKHTKRQVHAMLCGSVGKEEVVRSLQSTLPPITHLISSHPSLFLFFKFSSPSRSK